MDKHTQSLITVHIFLSSHSILMCISQMLLLQFRFDIYCVLIEKKTYISMWFDLSTYLNWSLIVLITVYINMK